MSRLLSVLGAVSAANFASAKRAFDARTDEVASAFGFSPSTPTLTPTLLVVPLGSADGVAWRFSNGNGTITGAPATVPGCAHADLLALRLIGEPNEGINHLLQRWIASDNFSYFTGTPVPLPPSLLARRNVDLVARGLDTAVTVFANGEVVLVASNSHRTYIIDVRSQLAPSLSAG